MRALRLGAYELLRFRTPMQRLGLAFLLLVPLLYGGIYLWSNWDPYSKIQDVPVAVVNEDRPVEVEGRSIDAGGDFVAELKREPVLGWRFTNAGEAADGLRDGRYYAIITVPPDFSAKLTSGATGTPQRAAMQIRLDDANNFLVGIMAQTIQAKLQQQIAAAAVSAYFQAAFGKLGELRDGLGKAAEGSGELAAGLRQAKDGSAQLAEGEAAAKKGSAALADGLGTAKQGSAALADGARQAKTGMGALVGGLQQAQTGTAALATGLGQAKQGSAALAGGLAPLDAGAGTLESGLATLKQGSAKLAPGAEQVSQGVHQLTTKVSPVIDVASKELPRVADLVAAFAADAAELTGLAAALADRVVHDTVAVDRWARGAAAADPPKDNPIAGSVQYKRLMTSLSPKADLEKQTAERKKCVDAVAAKGIEADGYTEACVRDLVDVFPFAGKRADYPSALASAKKLDGTLIGRLNLLAVRHPELLEDPVFREALTIVNAVADAALIIAAGVEDVDAVAQRIARAAAKFKQDVPALEKKLATALRDLRRLDAGGAQVAQGARQLDAGAGRLLAGADQLHAGTGTALAGARALDAGNAKLLAGADQLNAGSGQLLDGARKLSAGGDALVTGLDKLDDGNAKLLAGARQLDAGNGKLLDGARQLDSGNAQLLGGAKELNSGLQSAVDQVPSVDDPDGAARALATPVDVTTSNAHPATYYGRGLAPFFIAIALWVFGIVAFLLLRPVSGRLLASRASSFTVAFAAWLPVLVMGVLAALLLFAVLTVGLGLNAVNAAGTIGLMALGVATFSAIVHVLRLAFGAVGDALALALLMVQLVSCGGLYPMETLPQPFRAIHDVVPMTYFVAPMRVMISGGQTSHVVRDAAILTGYLTAALALLVLTVHLQRRWSMKRLKPELEL